MVAHLNYTDTEFYFTVLPFVREATRLELRPTGPAALQAQQQRLNGLYTDMVRYGITA